MQQLLPFFFSGTHVFPIIPTRAKAPGSGSSPLADAQDAETENHSLKRNMFLIGKNSGK